MPIHHLLQGLAIGFAIAIALGPIGLLVINRTLDRGWRYGLVSGAGVATGDATYAAIAAFGMTALSRALVAADRWLGIAGGLALLALAAVALNRARTVQAIEVRPDSGHFDSGRFATPIGAWASMLALTLANPMTILSFAALFTAIGAIAAGPGGGVALVAGVFAGSLAWWTLLTGIVAGLRAHMTTRLVRWLNVGSAIIIGALGAAAVIVGAMARAEPVAFR